MIEKMVKDHIKKTLKLPCYLEYPDKPESKFTIIEKTGSSYENYINYSTIAIQSYAESMYEAAKLNEEAKIAMLNMVELNEICSISLNSDYNFTDTTQKKYRYQAVFDIVYY